MKEKVAFHNWEGCHVTALQINDLLKRFIDVDPCIYSGFAPLPKDLHHITGVHQAVPERDTERLILVRPNEAHSSHGIYDRGMALYGIHSPSTLTTRSIS